MFWIPLIGPVIQGIVSIFTKQQDTSLAKYKAGADADVQDAKTASNIIDATKDDISLRILRDAAIVTPVVWSALIGWDTIVAIRFPNLMFHVANYPDSVGYLPYAALVFLLGNIGFNTWKRR